MAPLRCAAKFDPFLSLDCAPTPPPWRNPRKGRDQILPSGNLEHVAVARDARAVHDDVRYSGHLGLDITGSLCHGFAGSHIDLD